jgi:hypothetical protein
VHFVRAKHHHNPQRSASQIRYISHREEGLPGGERRELYAIGTRYMELRDQAQDFRAFERAVREQFVRDAGRRSRPTFHMQVFTVEDRAAAALMSVSRELAEQRLRTVLARTLRASAKGRRLQGVFAIHWHGGANRAAHPHIHALYSPTLHTGKDTYLGKADLVAIRRAWNREVNLMARHLGRGRDVGRTRDGAGLSREAPAVLRAVGHGRSLRAFVHRPVPTLARTVARAAVRSVLNRLAEPPQRGLQEGARSPVARPDPPEGKGRLSTSDIVRRLRERQVLGAQPEATTLTKATQGSRSLALAVSAPRRVGKVLTELARRASREI